MEKRSSVASGASTAGDGSIGQVEEKKSEYMFGLDDEQIQKLSSELQKLLDGAYTPDEESKIIGPSGDTTPLQLITDSASDDKLVKLCTNAIGKAPKKPDNSEETDVKFAVLIDLLSSNTNPKELRLQLEQLASVNQEMMEWREYELRAEAARKVYARMESERLNHPWNVFKRKVKSFFSK